MASTSKAPTNTCHVKIAPLSLPPLVEGQVKGELVVQCNSIAWASMKSPPAAGGAVQLRITFWGEQGAGTVVPLHPNRGAGAAFPVRCGPKYLARYLTDMGSLTCTLEHCPGGEPIGTMAVDVSRLDVSRPLRQESVPVVSVSNGGAGGGKVLGQASVALRINYSAVLSSFELNEHLATESSKLPLYPSPGRKRPPSTKQGETSEADVLRDVRTTATGKENAGAAARPNECGDASPPGTVTAAAAQQLPPGDQQPPELSAEASKLQELRQKTRERLQQLAAARAPALETGRNGQEASGGGQREASQASPPPALPHEGRAAESLDDQRQAATGALNAFKMGVYDCTTGAPSQARGKGRFAVGRSSQATGEGWGSGH